MTDDACQLLIRSYADQAARQVDPAPRIEVNLAEEGSGDVPSEFEVCFLYDGADPRSTSAAIAAQTRCLELLNADPAIPVTEDFSADDLFGITVWNCSQAEYDRLGQLRAINVFPDLAEAHRKNAPPPPEDAELAPALDPLSGPIEVQLPGQPDLQPNQPTHAMVIGLNLAKNRWTGEIYFSKSFDDPDRARYWATKQQRDHKAKGFRAVTHVLRQHDADPDDLLREVLAQLNPDGRGTRL